VIMINNNWNWASSGNPCNQAEIENQTQFRVKTTSFVIMIRNFVRTLFLLAVVLLWKYEVILALDYRDTDRTRYKVQRLTIF